MAVAAGLCYAIFGFAGMLLNLAIALAIHKDKAMQNLTYKFMVQLALSDIESLFGTTAFPGILIVSDIRTSDSILVRISAYCGGAGFHLSAFWMVFAAFSRWAALARKSRINQILTDRMVIILCVVFWIGMHVFYIPFLIYPEAFLPLGDSGAYAYLNNSVSQVYRIFEEGHNYFSFLLQLVFNVMSFAALISMRKQVMTPEIRAQNKKEIKLYVQCAIDSWIFSMFVITAYTVGYTEYYEQWIIIIIEIFLFLNHVDCALLYICFNRKIRQGIFGFFQKSVSSFGSASSAAVVKIVPKSDTN